MTNISECTCVFHQLTPLLQYIVNVKVCVRREMVWGEKVWWSVSDNS